MLEYRRSVDRNPWITEEPHPRQRQFLLLADVKEVFYGGAGGGGKSQALWYAALQYVTVPGYAALILRRHYTDLSLAGALMQRSKEYLRDTNGHWSEQNKTWTFPCPGGGRSTITFGYLEADGDEQRYRSSEYQFICFDELTDFSEFQYTFLFTRLRRLKGSDVPIRMRSASNPGGRGHTWVHSRFIDDRSRVAGVVFVPARIEDNPTLDADEYRASLALTDPITRRQVEEGDWGARASGRFRAEWFRRYTRLRGDVYGSGGEFELLAHDLERVERRYRWEECWRMITVDPAATGEQVAKKGKKKDPDYTVASVWAVTPDRHDLIWLDCDRFRVEVPDIVPRLQVLYSQYEPRFIAIEAVAANNAVYEFAVRTTPMVVRRLSPRGKEKLMRAHPAMLDMANGKVWLPLRSHWLLDVQAELLSFTGDDHDSPHDDVVDSLSYACSILNEGAGSVGAPPMGLGTTPFTR